MENRTLRSITIVKAKEGMASSYPCSRNGKTFLNLMAIFAILLAPLDLWAEESLRCGTRIVSIGDDSATVRDVCGEPNRIVRREEGGNVLILGQTDPEEEQYPSPGVMKGPVHIEIWTYDLGSNRFIRRLYFQDDELVRIETEEKRG